MKKALSFRLTLSIISLLLFIGKTHSQTLNKPINSFLGVKFGSTQQIVINLAKVKKGIYAKSTSSSNTLSYTNMKFASKPTFRVAFTFFENKLYEGRVFFKVDQQQNALEEYNKILADLNDVYGASGSHEREFKYPYEEGGKDEWIAIANNYATISDTWIDNTIPSAVKLFIMENGELICLWYQHLDLQDKAVAKRQIDY